MSEFPEWIPQSVRDYYPYITNIATKKVVTLNADFKEEHSRILWDKVIDTYAQPRIYLKHVTSAYFNAEKDFKPKEERKTLFEQHADIQKLATDLSEKLKKFRRLDDLLIENNPQKKIERYESLKALFGGNEYLAEESLYESMEHLRISKILELLAQEAREISKSIPIVYISANTKCHAFTHRLYSLIEGKKESIYKIINLSVLAVYGEKRYRSSNVINDRKRRIEKTMKKPNTSK